MIPESGWSLQLQAKEGTEEGMEELQEPKDEEEHDVAVVTVSSL